MAQLGSVSAPVHAWMHGHAVGASCTPGASHQDDHAHGHACAGHSHSHAHAQAEDSFCTETGAQSGDERCSSLCLVKLIGDGFSWSLPQTPGLPVPEIATGVEIGASQIARARPSTPAQPRAPPSC